MSLVDFHALELLTRAFPGEPWGLTPAEMEIGFLSSKGDDYLRRLNVGRAQHPPDDAKDQKSKNLSTAEKLRALDAWADRLLATSEPVPAADRLIHMRQHAAELGLNIKDPDLQRKLWEARRRHAGAIAMLTPGMAVPIKSSVWAWDRVILAGDTTLLAAEPKVGKTTLLIDAIARWHRGDDEHLGLAFCGHCPPVVIAGTDMPQDRWLRLLHRFGLAEPSGADSLQLRPDGPVRALFSVDAPIHLDPDGIARLADLAGEHPGSLLLVDSYAKLTAPLALKEASADFAGPLGDLQEAVAPHGTSLVVIHHSGRSRAGEGAVAASRGTTALPAAVSQCVALSWLDRARGSTDNRVVLQAEGRGAEPLQLLIEQKEEGWTSHGVADEVFAERRLAQAEDGLLDRQALALDFVREQWEAGLRTTSSQLVDGLGMKGSNSLRIARRTLKQLVDRGLLESAKEANANGQIVWHWPARAAGDPHTLSPLSDVSPVSPLPHFSPGAEAEIPAVPRVGTLGTERTGRRGRTGRGRPFSSPSSPGQQGASPTQAPTV